MNSQNAVIDIECLSSYNISVISKMSLELWPESHFEEEFENWTKISNSENNFCVLAKLNEEYIGFIHSTIRNDYVEGADFEKTAYLEALFVNPKYRKIGIASILLFSAENWAKSKDVKQMASDTEFENLKSQLFHKKVGFKEVNRIVCFIKNL